MSLPVEITVDEKKHRKFWKIKLGFFFFSSNLWKILKITKLWKSSLQSPIFLRVNFCNLILISISIKKSGYFRLETHKMVYEKSRKILSQKNFPHIFFAQIFSVPCVSRRTLRCFKRLNLIKLLTTHKNKSERKFSVREKMCDRFEKKKLFSWTLRCFWQKLAKKSRVEARK